MNWLTRLLGLDSPRERINAFFAMLRTRTYAIGPSIPADSPQLGRLRQILDTPPHDRKWNDAYEAEEIHAWLTDDSSLVALFETRATDATVFLSDKLIAERRAQFTKASDIGSRRIAVQALNEDLHEHWADEDDRTAYYDQITQATALGLLLSMVVFVLVFLAVRGHLAGSSSPLTPSLASMRSLAIVIGSGLFGACLSMLTGLRARLEAASLWDLEKMASWVNVLARAVVGAGGALVLFAMVVGGVLAGKAMPTLAGPLDVASLAHLVVLCILAGFSEKLVPNALKKMESDA